MFFKFKKEYKYSPDICFQTYKNHFRKLNSSLPNIKKIETIKTEKQRNIELVEQKWYLDFPLPRRVKTMLKIKEVSWRAILKWDDRKLKWIFKPELPIKSVRMFGVQKFLKKGETTIFLMEGNIKISLLNFPLIPKFLRPVISNVATIVTLKGFQLNFTILADKLGELLKSKPRV